MRTRGEGACSRWGVGAVECNEAAIFSETLESQAKDQKIAAFGSSYRQREQAPSPRDRVLFEPNMTTGSAPAGRFFMGANQRAEYFSKAWRHRARVTG